MKVVLTLLVRDEADIVDAHLAFHFAAGVDFVIATDHRSGDGTSEILERYASEGVLRVIREESQVARQAEWQTRMARLAATEHGADWVIPSDADEFWWPRAGSIPEALASVPAEFGVVRALTRNFVPPYDDHGWFGDRMTLRLATPAPINDPGTPFRPVVKVAHRGHPPRASSRAEGIRSSACRGRSSPTGIPSRSSISRSARASSTHGSTRRPGPAGPRTCAATWPVRGRSRSRVARRRCGHASRSATRRSVRALRPGRSCATRGCGTPWARSCESGLRSIARSTLPTPAPEEQTRHAVEAAVFDEAEVVRAQRWVDELSERVARLEKAGQSA